MRKSVALLSAGVLAVLLASGVAFAATVNCVAGEVFCVGTKNDDTLNGSEERDEMYGQAGSDQLFGNGGDDEFVGGDETDTFRGGEGSDTASYQAQKGTDKIYGEGGNDYLDDSSYNRRREVDDRNVLNGGEGDDYLDGYTKLYGGPGDDTLYISFPYKKTRTTLDGGPGLDSINGDQSVDTVYAQDGERDEIACGGNTDTVYYDAGIDVVNPVNCERRIATPAP